MPGYTEKKLREISPLKNWEKLGYNNNRVESRKEKQKSPASRGRKEGYYV